MVLQVLLYGFVTGTEILLVALGLYLVYRVSRVINLALGGIAAAVAYAYYFGGIFCAIATAIVLGVVNYAINEKLTSRGQHLFALLTSFALALGLEAIIAIAFGTDGKSYLPGILPVVSLGQYQLSVPGVIIIAFGILVAVSLVFFYFATPVGRTLTAISEHHFSAVSLGINHSKVRLIVYICVAIVVGVIGTLVGFDTALTPTMGFNLIIMAFIAFLVGGVDDLRGTIVAAYVVGVIPELIIGLTPSVSANWRMSIVFVIATILLIIRPAGIFKKQLRIS